MSNPQTEARAIVEEYEKRSKTSILINLIATVLAAKDAELAESWGARAEQWRLRREAENARDMMSALATTFRAERDEARAQLAEARKALDAVFDDTQARTKAGMTYGINGHPTLSPATLNIVAQARFAARQALATSKGGE